jgi:hypothetical protein
MIYTFEVRYTEGKLIKQQYFEIQTAKTREEAFRKALEIALDFYVPNCLVSIRLARVDTVEDFR